MCACVCVSALGASQRQRDSSSSSRRSAWRVPWNWEQFTLPTPTLHIPFPRGSTRATHFSCLPEFYSLFLFFFFVLCFVCHFYLTPKSVRIPKLNPNPTTTKVSPARCSLCADSLVLAPTPLWAQGTLVTRQTQSPIRFRCGTIVYCVGFYGGAWIPLITFDWANARELHFPDIINYLVNSHPIRNIAKK